MPPLQRGVHLGVFGAECVPCVLGWHCVYCVWGKYMSHLRLRLVLPKHGRQCVYSLQSWVHSRVARPDGVSSLLSRHYLDCLREHHLHPLLCGQLLSQPSVVLLLPVRPQHLQRQPRLQHVQEFWWVSVVRCRVLRVLYGFYRVLRVPGGELPGLLPLFELRIVLQRRHLHAREHYLPGLLARLVLRGRHLSKLLGRHVCVARRAHWVRVLQALLARHVLLGGRCV